MHVFVMEYMLLVQLAAFGKRDIRKLYTINRPSRAGYPKVSERNAKNKHNNNDTKRE